MGVDTRISLTAAAALIGRHDGVNGAEINWYPINGSGGIKQMRSDQDIRFEQDAVLSHAFFGHWLDGTRVTVPFEDRGFRLERDNRRFVVQPDPDELVEQKHREVVA